ncbi:unnamed protein product [Pieris brassicae]|uniref:Uncharacterized protein n=1 Tax=Pieris brassicae TaxID=7116 RepID=A0A9P0XIB3_PIEBR|nr:unnamed protein product [Pieris brassicae]
MGSDNCRKHLSSLAEHLTKFEQAPKEIKGRRLNAWFLVGEDIFKELFEIGRSINWQYSEIRKFDVTSNICSQIERNADWIETLISLYPNYRIDFDLVGSSDDICQVRSGIDVLFKGFEGINTNFDKVLQDLNKAEGDDRTPTRFYFKKLKFIIRTLVVVLKLSYIF